MNSRKDLEQAVTEPVLKDIIGKLEELDASKTLTPDCPASAELTLAIENLDLTSWGQDSAESALCIRAGLLLWNDELDKSHSVSQSISSSSGSYWHGIMHRREPDYSNAKYWFRKVPEHPVYDKLFQLVHDEEDVVDSDSVRDFIATVKTAGAWDPFAFVDLAEKAAGGKDSELFDFVIELQLAEIRLLLCDALRA